MASILIILAALPLFLLFLLPKLRKHHQLPPGPSGLPLIGNLHQLEPTELPRYLWQLSKQYGPLMTIHIGLNPTLVISSAKMAKEILKTNDLIFCSRPSLLGQKTMSYDNSDIESCPYNDYWREIRKICTLHLFSTRRVVSFGPVREEEVSRMIEKISQLASLGKPVNLSETLMALTSTIICRVAFGKRYEGVEMKQFDKLIAECLAVTGNFYFTDLFPIIGWVDKLTGKIARLEKSFKDMDQLYQELIDEHLKPEWRPNKGLEDIIDLFLRLKEDQSSSIEITFDRIKAVVMNILFGGTETSAATVVWAMTLLIKNPTNLKKVQAEVRNVVGKKGKVEEKDISNMTYLKAVIKEAMRLYPIVPPLVPRESMGRCVLNGYEIPAKTTVFVNALAVGRDPDCWEDPDEFLPQRFLDCDTIDYYKATDYDMLPFGAGRRVCPGMTMGVATVELTISNLLYTFDWELPAGVKEEDVDTMATSGVTMHKKNALCLVAKVYNYGHMED